MTAQAGSGQGGTQTSGGSGASYGADGSALQGGNGDTRGFRTSGSMDGGGGGGGYFGGEGGYSDARSGGGGSGFVDALVTSSMLLTGNRYAEPGGKSEATNGGFELLSGRALGSSLHFCIHRRRCSLVMHAL